jgi:TAT (twin-arginine translocation) pathway signal sequence
MSIACDWRMSRRDFLQGTAMAAVALGLPSPARAEDPPNTHNMLVFGNQTVFFSHLPMFHRLNASGTEFVSPHRFQVILQAALTAEQMAAYVKDRQAHADAQFYTLGPEELVLTRLFEPKTAPQATEFTATVFRGHLEAQPNHPVRGLEQIKVKIGRVVHGRKFDPKAVKPEALEYLLLGRGAERFLAHAISAPPDFDHVLNVSVTPNPSDRDLEQEVRVSIPGRKNVAAQRLREGQRVDAMMHAGSGAPVKVQLEAGKRIYFEEGELLVPPTPDPTPEEKND